MSDVVVDVQVNVDVEMDLEWTWTETVMRNVTDELKDADSQKTL